MHSSWLSMICHCKIPLLAGVTVLLLMAFAAVNSSTLTCQTFEASAVPYCTYLNYSMVGLPNGRDHVTQMEAFTEMQDFKSVIETGCLGAILFFLCGYYVPICVQINQGESFSLLPCRNLCMEVRSKCEQCIPGNQWPPHLDCQIFPNELPCFGPSDPSAEPFPSNIPGITVTSASCVSGEALTTTNLIQPTLSSFVLHTTSLVERLSTSTMSSVVELTLSLSPTKALTVTDPTDAANTIVTYSLTILICAALAVVLL